MASYSRTMLAKAGRLSISQRLLHRTLKQAPSQRSIRSLSSGIHCQQRSDSVDFAIPEQGHPRRFSSVVAAGVALTASSIYVAVGKDDETALCKKADKGKAKATSNEEEAKIRRADSKEAMSIPFKHKPKVLFVLGGPGAGKGTQSEMIVEHYGFKHLSAGDLLREERASGSKDGVMIDKMIKEGQIVPVAVTLGLLRRAMLASGQELFLIDGFPRNYDNLTGWNDMMGEAADVEGVLFYDCPEEEMEKRLINRGKTSGRTDDNIESIRKRFRTYLESTMPIINEFDKIGKVHRISASASPEQVFQHTKKAVEKVVGDHILRLNERLLTAIDTGDWATYEELVDENVSCYEPESLGHLVEGYKFHEFFFKNGGPHGKVLSQSTMSDCKVRISGSTAVVTCTRLIQQVKDNAADDQETHQDKKKGKGKAKIRSVQETRVWERTNGNWKLTHLHRSGHE